MSYEEEDTCHMQHTNGPVAGPPQSPTRSFEGSRERGRERRVGWERECERVHI